jgi:hypothetical protein
MDETAVVVNPLHGLVCLKKFPRPRWMCRHVGARLLDSKKRIYECAACNPTLGTITVIPNVPTTKTSPKKVTVSPTPESPKGFKD